MFCLGLGILCGKHCCLYLSLFLNLDFFLFHTSIGITTNQIGGSEVMYG
jgi:hypothetical protein